MIVGDAAKDKITNGEWSGWMPGIMEEFMFVLEAGGALY